MCARARINRHVSNSLLNSKIKFALFTHEINWMGEHSEQYPLTLGQQ